MLFSFLLPRWATRLIYIYISNIYVYICMKVEVLITQLCPTPCNPTDSSPTGSSVHGILQARIVEWVVISYSRGSSRPRDRTQVSCIFCIGRHILYMLNHLGSLILCIVLYICQSQSPNLSLPPLITMFVFYICDSISIL